MAISSARGADLSATNLSPTTIIRVMIVDDSITARTVLSRIIDCEPDMQVVTSATSAEKALAILETTEVDVILLDLEMPGMGGLNALPKIIETARNAQIMVVSSLTVAGAEPTIAALSLGAADTLSKPAVGKFDQLYRDSMLAKIRALGSSKLPVVRKPSPVRLASRSSAEVVAIGASTGGIHALAHFFAGLPRRLEAPILVTQHLPASLMETFARQLQVASGYEASLAKNGAPLVSGRILVAPGDAHLRVAKRDGRLVAHLSREPAESGFMPSVDPMFSSLAEALGSHSLGVVLSGMGRDGANGAAQIVTAGGSIFAQDQASSAVWGMPRVVAEAGLASAVLPPGEIATRVAACVGGAHVSK